MVSRAEPPSISPRGGVEVLLEAIVDATRVRNGNRREWEQGVVPAFEHLRRALLHAARLGILDAYNFEDDQMIEDTWLFLIEVRRRQPARRRRVAECARACCGTGLDAKPTGERCRWRRIFQTSPVVRSALDGLTPEGRDELSAAALGANHSDSREYASSCCVSETEAPLQDACVSHPWVAKPTTPAAMGTATPTGNPWATLESHGEQKHSAKAVASVPLVRVGQDKRQVMQRNPFETGRLNPFAQPVKAPIKAENRNPFAVAPSAKGNNYARGTNPFLTQAVPSAYVGGC